jgi:O-antigen ligase
MLVSWLSSGQVLPSLKISFSLPISIALFCFLLVLIIGSFYSAVDLKQSFATVWNWRKLFYIFILLSLFNSLLWKNRFITIFIGGMSLALFFSYLAWFEIVPSRKGVLGIIATNYTVQSMSFVVATICCVIQIPHALAKHKIIYLTLVLLFCINILFISESRTGYISLFTGLPIAALLSYKKNKTHYVLISFALLLLLTLLSSTTLQNRIKQGINELTSYEKSPALTSIGIRAVFYQHTLELIKQKPILGYGTGSFGHIYKQHIYDKYNNWRSIPTTDPHNQFLFICTENGVIGLLIFLCFIITVIRQGMITDKYGTIATCIICAWTIASLFNSIFKTFLEGHLFGLFIGVMLAPITAQEPEK